MPESNLIASSLPSSLRPSVELTSALITWPAHSHNGDSLASSLHCSISACETSGTQLPEKIKFRNFLPDNLGPLVELSSLRSQKARIIKRSAHYLIGGPTNVTRSSQVASKLENIKPKFL